jgi:hypothetical protein
MNRLPEDPVVAEIHAIRQALLDACGGDMTEYRRRARARQAESRRRIITVPFRRRTEQGVAPESPASRVPDGQSNPATG